MRNENMNRCVTDEERREFLKALGVGGAIAAGGLTLGEVRDAVSTADAEALASIGEAIAGDLAGDLDPGLLATQQTALADATTELTGVVDRGLTREGPRENFLAVAEAGRPIYDHLESAGFFESTTTHLPEFTPAHLEESVTTFVESERLASPLSQLGLSGAEDVDLVATVIANAEQIRDYHWVATDQIPRERFEFGELIPPMTQAAAGGVLLWLEDLDSHLWKHQVLVTDEILADADWHARSMAAGFQLMSEGAKAIASGSNELSDAELGALLSTGFAVQAIAQNLLPSDVYWITEEMRGQRRTDLEITTTYK